MLPWSTTLELKPPKWKVVKAEAPFDSHHAAAVAAVQVQRLCWHDAGVSSARYGANCGSVPWCLSWMQ